MGVVVDTSIVVEFERRGAAPEALASFVPSETIFLSAITVGELFYGLERTANPARRTQRSAYLEGLIESIDVPRAAAMLPSRAPPTPGVAPPPPPRRPTPPEFS